MSLEQFLFYLSFVPYIGAAAILNHMFWKKRNADFEEVKNRFFEQDSILRFKRLWRVEANALLTLHHDFQSSLLDRLFDSRPPLEFDNIPYFSIDLADSYEGDFTGVVEFKEGIMKDLSAAMQVPICRLQPVEETPPEFRARIVEDLNRRLTDEMFKVLARGYSREKLGLDRETSLD